MAESQMPTLPQDVMDEVRLSEQETYERSVNRLIFNKVWVPEEKQDVDREVWLYNLFTLKKQAEDALAAELAKGTVYTKREAEEKQANLENNYREIWSVNKEETLKDFHAKMKLIKTAKDMYYSPLSDLSAMVEI